ncbi:DDE-type integrase/transposase/recombinase [Microbacterium sp. 1P06AB]|uniref:DDE-type integrase/transposase/recombinase n=1 Tax=Microbacterium sp. 1P06AB TaxID=3132289 RepID=UPI0039A4F09B
MAERTAWRICRDNGWWSAFGKPRRGKGRRPGPPVHDDLVRREFNADAPNRLWLSDTEHKTGEGKLYLCAINDVFSNRIVGSAMSDRMKARLAVDAVNSAVTRRGNVAGCVVHTDRGSQFRARKMVREPDPHRPHQQRSESVQLEPLHSPVASVEARHPLACRISDLRS